MNTATYTTTRIARNGKQLPGSAQHRYASANAEMAARNEARHLMSASEYASATAERQGNTWTFTPANGSTVRVRVTQDAQIR